MAEGVGLPGASMRLALRARFARSNSLLTNLSNPRVLMLLH